MEIKLSIILPVFNVEKYLERCIDSLLMNRIDEVEILLVDDGSTDSSLEICKKYEEKYPCVKTYHKSNGGLSDARNYGLYHSKGKYVMFVDSDDMLAAGAIESILNRLEEQPEIVLFDAELVDENDRKLPSQSYYSHIGLNQTALISGVEAIKNQLQATGDYVTAVCLGVYNREFIISNGLWFEKGLLHEDELWTQKAFLCAERVEYVPEKMYLYRQRESSIMAYASDIKTNKYKNIKSCIFCFTSLYSYADWKIEARQMRIMFKANVTKRYLHMLAAMNAYKYPELLVQINRMQLLKNGRGIKDKARAIVFAVSPRLYSRISAKLGK